MPDKTEPPTTEIVKFDYNGDMIIQNRRDLQSLLVKFSNRIGSALPKGAAITKASLIEAAMLAAVQSPKILRCTQGSIIESVLKAARFGLDCSGALRSAYLVPFGNKCQLIIGYGGFLDLARRAAKILDIDVQLIYDGDDITLEMGTSPKVKHIPDRAGTRTPDKITGCYAVATFTDGTEKKVEYMSRSEVDRIRMRSKAKGPDSPWTTDTGEMTRKTVIRRLIKYLPISVVEAGQLLAEAEQHDNETAGVTKQLEAQPGARLAALKAQLDGEREEPIDGEVVEPSDVLGDNTGAAGKHQPPPDEPWIDPTNAPHPDPIDPPKTPTGDNLFDDTGPPAAAH